MEKSGISVSCYSEFGDYTYNKKHDIWTLISLKAPPCGDENEEENKKKISMDIVAVMDKSGSMAGEKLDLVKKTLEFVLTQCMYTKSMVYLVDFHLSGIFRPVLPVNNLHTIPVWWLFISNHAFNSFLVFT